MSSWYPVPQNPTHGIFVQRHAKAVALLHDVYVLYCAGSDQPQNEIINRSTQFTEQIHFYDRSGKSAFAKFKTQRKFFDGAFEKLVKEWGRPDIIHLNVIFPAGIFAFRIARKYGIPLVITEHWTGYLPEDGSYRGILKKHFTKKIVSHAAAICPVTKHLAEAMQRHGLKGDYHPVPNVVDTVFFSPAQRSPDKDIVFLHLSSFDERQKNPKSIIAAFLKLREKNQNVKLIMAGDGENIEQLKELSGGSNSVEFHYRPQGTDLLQLFRRSDALVLNSNYENLPVVLLEAMSCGLPVISSNVGGIAEYVNHQNGMLYYPPSVENLEEAMTEFIQQRERFNREKIREFAVTKFSMQTIAERYSEVYRKVSE